MRAAPHPLPHPLPAGRGGGAEGEGRQDGGGEVGRAGRRCCRRHRRRLRSSRLWFFKLSPPGEAVQASDPAGKVSPLLSPFLSLHSPSRTASHSHPPQGAVRGRAGGGRHLTPAWGLPRLSQPPQLHALGALGGTVPAVAPPRSLPPPVSAGPCGRRAWGSRAPGAPLSRAGGTPFGRGGSVCGRRFRLRLGRTPPCFRGSTRGLRGPGLSGK